MKRYIVLVLLAVAGLLTASALPAAAQQQANRVGFINSQRILAQAPGTGEAQRAFEADMERFRAELDTLETQLQTLQENFERQQATLSPQARQERQQEMQQRFMVYQQRRGELEETAQRRQQELVEPIMRRISEVIEELRREGNYAMIFDASAGGLITADPTLDLTEQVLERLRRAPSGR